MKPTRSRGDDPELSSEEDMGARIESGYFGHNTAIVISSNLHP